MSELSCTNALHSLEDLPSRLEKEMKQLYLTPVLGGNQSFEIKYK
jgi:hypothetical protein